MSLLPISTYPQNPPHPNINLQIPKPSSKNHNPIKIYSQKPNSNPQPHKEIDSKDAFIPRKTKRGEKSEAMKVEDFVRNSLGNTFTSIKEQNPDVFSGKDQILKEKKSTHFDGDKKSTHFNDGKTKRGRESEARKVEDFVRNSLGNTFTSIKEQNPELFSGKDPILKEKKSTHFDGRKTKRGEDFVRNSLGNTFTSIKEQNPDVFSNKDPILEDKKSTHFDFIDDGDGDGDEMVIDEEDIDWPIDGEVGWGTSASKYFEEYPIKNWVGEDGVEIDWEGEVDDSWIQEINCLEWEAFAFHPSPLIVLVFERYHRASDNWKLLKEIEKALQVYWNAKDRLPPRAVKLDINIERDLAYALKVRECPQLLFLRGQKILYREKEFRSADELVQMIAYFYYKAKKPSWIDEAILRL